MNSEHFNSDSAVFGDGCSTTDLLDNQSGLIGLQNIGNTCYMNAALQALSNCPPLTKYFQVCSQAVACRLTDRGRGQSIARCYAQLIEDLWSSNQQNHRRVAVVDPSNLAAQFRSIYPAFRLHTQQDAQEFLRCFLDRIHEELCEPAVCFLDSNDFVNSDQRAETSPINASTVSDSGAGGLTLTMTSSQISNSSSSDLLSIPPSQSFLKFSEKNPAFAEDQFDTAEEEDIMECDKMAEDFELIDDSVQPCKQQPDILARLETVETPPHLYKRITSISESSPQLLIQQPNQLQRSIVSDLFDGQIRSCVKCLTCGNVSTTKERFQDLSLPIPNYPDLMALRKSQSSDGRFVNYMSSSSALVSGSSWFSWVKSWLPWSTNSTIPTLNDCLAAFFVADELKGDDMYSCSNCQKLRNGVRYAELLEPLPELLCIHLKRFRHDLNSGVSKIKQAVHFPLTGLDLRPYMVSEASSPSFPGDNISTVYDLVAVVRHDGVPTGGHYTAICQNESSGLWYEYDDECCTQTSLDLVTRAQAYVLFYRRRPAPDNALFLCKVATLLFGVQPSLARSLSAAAMHQRRLHSDANLDEDMENNCKYDGSVAMTHSESFNELHHRARSTPPIDFSHSSRRKAVSHHSLSKRARKSSKKISKKPDLTPSNSINVSPQHSPFFDTTKASPSVSLNGSMIVFYVSKKWLVRLQCIALPGPISNYDFMCEHGAVQPKIFPYVSDLVEPIPEDAWQLLFDKFGGGPQCNKLNECHWCRAEAEQLRVRQKTESETYAKISEDQPKLYAIAMSWWRKWRAFLSNQTNQAQVNNLLLTHPSGVLLPPGPIDNMPIAVPVQQLSSSPTSGSTLSALSATTLQRCQLRSTGCVDYFKVNETTWRYLQGIYGGGPEIILTN